MVLIEKKLLPLQSGVAKLIDQAFAKGVKVAICSTSNEKAVCFIRFQNNIWCSDSSHPSHGVKISIQAPEVTVAIKGASGF
ncbi:CBBY-like protein isoform X2 [Daucus carota subsp. sativus]|uniref:CBBY-like protein isoform X2 n=1 Tax=Daucus carota subsp. sativus TaxID=79200 RepID=UPI0030826E48